MSDSVRLYYKVYETLNLYMEEIPDEHRIVLARTIMGLVKGKEARFSEMAKEIPNPVKNESIEKQLRRFHKNAYVETKQYYAPFVQLLLDSLGEQTLCVVLDGSAVARKCVCQMAGIVFQNRVLPLTWLVYKGKKGHASAEQHIQLLEQLFELLPEDSDVILLGDGEYDNVEMLEWIHENTAWDYVIRTAKSCYLLDDDRSIRFEELGVEEGEWISVEDTYFTKQEFGPIHALAHWGQGYDEPHYLLTRLTEPDDAIFWYSKRPLIETLFSDEKSRGFNIQKSGLRDPKRVDRLMMSVSLAYLWMIYLGCQVIFKGNEGLIAREERCDKSLFQLGLTWMKYVLKHSLDFVVRFHIPRYLVV